MRNIKIRHINIVDAIYKSGSLKDAASLLGLTPAAVSKACIDFETILNVKLFERTHAGMIPTEVCESVIESGRSIRVKVEQLWDNVADAPMKPKGFLWIGYQENPLQERLFDAVSRCYKTIDCNIKLFRESREKLLNGLDDGIYDFVIMNFYQSKNRDNFHYIKMMDYKCLFANRKGAMSAKDVFDNWGTHARETWALPPKGFAIRDRFDSLLHVSDLQYPHRIIEYNSRKCVDSILMNMDVNIILPQYAIEMAREYFPIPNSLVFIPEMRMESGIIINKNFKIDPRAEMLLTEIISQSPVGDATLTGVRCANPMEETW